MADAVMIAASAARSGPRTIEPPVTRRRHLALAWLAGEPLVPPAAGLTTGILLDSVYPIPFSATMAVFLAAGGLLICARRRDRLRYVAIILAAVALGATLHDVHFRHWPEEHLVRYVGNEPAFARITGIVADTPVIVPCRSGRITWIPQLPRTRLLIETDGLAGVSGPIRANGLVGVTVREPLLGIHTGDRVELFGMLRRPAVPANPGERNWRLVNRRLGVLVEMSCEHAANVSIRTSRNTREQWLTRARRFACAAMLEDAFEEDSVGARLLEALVLGQRSAVDEDLNQAFINTGTVHYLSVSGAHVGVLVMFVWVVGWLLGKCRRQCALWAGAGVVAYAILTEPSPAIIRSAIMAVVLCVTIWAGRPVHAANGLAAAAIVLLAAQSTQLFDPGFQLSFLTLLAIMYLSPCVHGAGKWAHDKLLRRNDPLLQPDIQRMLNPRSRRRIVTDYCLGRLGWWFAMSAAAWMVGAMVSACHFRQVPPWGWLNTVLITLPMSAVLLLGLAKTVCSLVLPQGAILLGRPLEYLTDALIAIVRQLDRLPGSGSQSPEIPAWLAAAGVTVLAFWVVAGPLHIRRRWVALAMTGFLVLATWNVLPHRPADTLRLHVLSIGDGTACVLQMPGGGSRIYDLGARPPYDMQRWTVGPFLAHERIRSIDSVVLSHPQLDHFSGVPDLLDRVAVGEVLTAPHFAQRVRPGTPAERFVADLRARDLPWRTTVKGARLAHTGEATIEVLWPPRMEDQEIRDDNNSSVVLRITHAGRRILLCGDIEEAAQKHLLLSPHIRADVLILPHHGGVTRTTGAFIEAVNPEYCIRSSGQRDCETTNGLFSLMAGRICLSTADRGAVEVRIAPGEFSVRPFR